MKVFYDTIDKDIYELESTFSFKEDTDSYSVRFVGAVYKADGSYFLRGDVSAELSCPCDRCLDITSINFGFDLGLGLEPGGTIPETSGEYELSDEEGESYFTPLEYFDINDIIRQEVIIQSPLKRLCGKDCNQLYSLDKSSAIDADKNPFSVLSALKKL